MEERKKLTTKQDSGVFDFKDGPPFAISYLNTYYTIPPTADETAVSHFLINDFKQQKPSGIFLELGCGPTVHHIFPFAPHVTEIHMADYLDDNLEQVRLWKEDATEAHNWDAYIGLTLRHEGLDVNAENIKQRRNLARKNLTKIFNCDLKSETPSEYREKYDVVGCFYCAEEIGISIPEWQKVIKRVSDYIKPGGTLYMAALAGMDSYHVTDSSGVTHDYPCANVNENEIHTALSKSGFLKDSIRIKTADIEHPDCGVTATLSVAAEKSK